MSVIIGEAVPSPHTPSTFEIEITIYHGDGDHYATFVLGPLANTSENKEKIEKIVTVLNRIEPFYPNGRGGDYEKYGYQNVPGYDDFFGQGAEYQDEWPFDEYGELQGTLDKYEVFYYSVDKTKYAVAVTPESE